jgi:hypothetical protein
MKALQAGVRNSKLNRRAQPGGTEGGENGNACLAEVIQQISGLRKESF